MNMKKKWNKTQIEEEIRIKEDEEKKGHRKAESMIDYLLSDKKKEKTQNHIDVDYEHKSAKQDARN